MTTLSEAFRSATKTHIQRVWLPNSSHCLPVLKQPVSLPTPNFPDRSKIGQHHPVGIVSFAQLDASERPPLERRHVCAHEPLARDDHHQQRFASHRFGWGEMRLYVGLRFRESGPSFPYLDDRVAALRLHKARHYAHEQMFLGAVRSLERHKIPCAAAIPNKHHPGVKSISQQDPFCRVEHSLRKKGGVQLVPRGELAALIQPIPTYRLVGVSIGRQGFQRAADLLSGWQLKCLGAPADA